MSIPAPRTLGALFLSLALLLATPAALSQQEDFVVSEITLVGLDKVEPSTVLAFVGFDRGDTVDEEVLAATVSRLFESGLFRDIEILREGDEVVINLSENPTIKGLRFEGMVNLDEETVLELLEGQDIATGRIFKRGNSEYIEQVISDFYRQNSRFLATAEVVTVPLPNNQVDLVVAVSEGPQAEVSEINFYGNDVFSDSDLKDLFELKESGLVSSLFDSDVFTREGFDGDLDRLRRMYLNSGYVRFLILSSDVRVESDEGGIVIDIFISEGAQYQFSEPELNLASSLVTREQALAEATFVAGDTFSDRLVESYSEGLRRLMRQEGHAFAKVEADTNINDETLKVELSFTLEPDVIAEVNRIRFVGNNLTRDLVLRRQMELVEGETFSLDKLEYSLTRLRRSGYLREARAVEKRVDGDKVDVDVEVEEQGTGQFVIGAGYSSSDGVSFRTDFARNNIFGTGNDLRIKFGFSKTDRNLNFEFEEPGISDSGITRKFSLYYNSEQALGSVVTDDVRNYGSGLSYRIPINRNWSWNFGGALEINEIRNSESLIDEPSTPFDDRSSEYVTEFGDKQLSTRLITGIGYDSRDRAFDTTRGARFFLDSETTVPPADVEYYQIRLHTEYYKSIDEEARNVLHFRFQTRYGDDYGNGIYPYYKRFFLSSGQLRVFDADQIGPIGNNSAIGGQLAINGNAEIERKVRLLGVEGVRVGLFVDAAGLWHDTSHFEDTAGDFRVAAGGLVKIRTPVFPIALSYGIPLRKKEGDVLEQFQFRIGF